MADETFDTSVYRDAIQELLLNGEELEAVSPASLNVGPDSDTAQAIGITSHRVIVCHRRLRSGSYDRWTFRSVVYSRIEQVDLYREEQFRKDRIDAHCTVTVHLSRTEGGHSARVELVYRDSAIAREVHDRILAHLLTVESRGLP